MRMLLDAAVHPDEDDIERYSMGAVSEEETACFEEHLLICENCRLLVAESDAFVSALRGAGARIARKVPAQRRLPLFFPRWVPAYAPAFAALALLTLATLAALRFGWMGSTAPAIAVNLQATRGVGAEAPPRRPLTLALDLTGLPQLPSYRVEMVDATGNRVWQGMVAADNAKATAQVPPKNRGAYFVRVYTPSGEILREFGLEVRND